jgi:uncharacterized protein (TIGR03437 family)
MPAAITTRPGQSSVEFQIDAASAAAGSAEIAARLGMEVVQDRVTVERSRRPVLSVPHRKLLKSGTEVSFRVFGMDADARVSATSLPAGATFDPATGNFDWTPTETQEGMYRVIFNGFSPTGEMTTESAELEVDGGAPAITRVINAASQSLDAVCSPGAIGRIEGRWLSGESAAVSDTSGNSLRLSGTAVTANGSAVPVLYASATRVDFLCPVAVAGSQLQIVVDTAAGRSSAVQTTVRDLAPGIFHIDGSDDEKGMVLHSDGTGLVMVRNYRYAAKPAQPGEVITLYATGLEEAAKVLVRFGQTAVEPDSTAKVPDVPGVWLLSVRVPPGEFGNAVGLSIEGYSANGMISISNQIRIAIEAPER